MMLTDVTPGEVLTLATGDLEMWRVKDGRVLIHLVLTGKRQMWIELSSEQARWLARQLDPDDCCVCGRKNMLTHLCEFCYEKYVA